MRSASHQDARKTQSGPGIAAAAPRAVFLVGFMGAGKTSVGRALGDRLRWVFEDLDDRIERREGRTVAEVFRASGERGFRRAERIALQEVLEELRSGGSKIVALGGGAFAQKGNATLLTRARVPTVFLDAPVEELRRRCERQRTTSGTERPLLSSPERFSKLYQTRQPAYLKAMLRIETGGRSMESLAREIADALGLKPDEGERN
jgi:shikimate kinase